MNARPKCDRCRRPYRGRGDWNVVVRQGVPLGMLCPKCQTPEENLEAEVNEATLDYSRAYNVGDRVAIPPKGMPHDNESLIRDMLDRVQDALFVEGRAFVDTGEPFTPEGVVTRVEAELPARYPFPPGPDRGEFIRDMVLWMLDQLDAGTLYDDEEEVR